MAQYGRDDARRAVGGRGHHLPAICIFFIHRHGIDIKPIKKLLTFIGQWPAMELIPNLWRAPLNVKPARQSALRVQPTLNTSHHHFSNSVEREICLSTRTHGVFIGVNYLMNF